MGGHIWTRVWQNEQSDIAIQTPPSVIVCSTVIQGWILHLDFMTHILSLSWLEMVPWSLMDLIPRKLYIGLQPN